jgi:very-short-patch-repair endonuclease
MDGVLGHQTISLPGTDRTVFDRIPVTTPERTLVDGCGLVTLPELERCTDDLLRRGVIVLRKLVRCHETVPVSGRRKSAPVAKLLRERVPGFHPGGSDRELDVMRVLRRAGVAPLPRQQFRVHVGVRTYRLDFAWPETRHYLEFDGFDAHRSVTSFHADRARMRAMQRAGWTPWHVTARTSDAELVAIALEAVSPLRTVSGL